MYPGTAVSSRSAGFPPMVATPSFSAAQSVDAVMALALGSRDVMDIQSPDDGSHRRSPRRRAMSMEQSCWCSRAGYSTACFTLREPQPQTQATPPAGASCARATGPEAVVSSIARPIFSDSTSSRHFDDGVCRTPAHHPLKWAGQTAIDGGPSLRSQHR